MTSKKIELVPLAPHEMPFDVSTNTCFMRPVGNARSLGRCGGCEGLGVPFPTVGGGHVNVFPFKSIEASRKFTASGLCQTCQDKLK